MEARLVRGLRFVRHRGVAVDLENGIVAGSNGRPVHIQHHCPILQNIRCVVHNGVLVACEVRGPSQLVAQLKGLNRRPLVGAGRFLLHGDLDAGRPILALQVCGPFVVDMDGGLLILADDDVHRLIRAPNHVRRLLSRAGHAGVPYDPLRHQGVAVILQVAEIQGRAPVCIRHRTGELCGNRIQRRVTVSCYRHVRGGRGHGFVRPDSHGNLIQFMRADAALRSAAEGEGIVGIPYVERRLPSVGQVKTPVLEVKIHLVIDQAAANLPDVEADATGLPFLCAGVEDILCADIRVREQIFFMPCGDVTAAVDVQVQFQHRAKMDLDKPDLEIKFQESSIGEELGTEVEMYVPVVVFVPLNTELLDGNRVFTSGNARAVEEVHGHVQIRGDTALQLQWHVVLKLGLEIIVHINVEELQGNGHGGDGRRIPAVGGARGLDLKAHVKSQVQDQLKFQIPNIHFETGLGPGGVKIRDLAGPVGALHIPGEADSALGLRVRCITGELQLSVREKLRDDDIRRVLQRHAQHVTLLFRLTVEDQNIVIAQVFPEENDAGLALQLVKRDRRIDIGRGSVH